MNRQRLGLKVLKSDVSAKIKLRPYLALAVAMLSTLAITGVSWAGSYDVVQKIKVKNNKAGATTQLDLDSTVLSFDGSPPPKTTKQFISLPLGATINPNIVKVCDWERLKQGERVCGSDTELGVGEIDVNGSLSGLGLFKTDVTVYKIKKNPGEAFHIGLVAEEDTLSARVYLDVPVVKVNGRFQLRIADVPEIVGLKLIVTHGHFLIDATKAAKITVKSKGGKKKKKRIKQALFNMPKTCPANRTWTFTMEQGFEDGNQINTDIPVTCRP